MIHNGIEYADMQLIAETYDLMRQVLGLDYPAMQAAFAEWNRGELDSYLIEITADILGKRDPETGQPMVEVILDRAGQKGTGGWALEAALELGVPAPTIAEAVAARSLSALKAERVAAAGRLAGPAAGPGADLPLAALRDALLAAKLCAYAQGFAVMAGAAKAYGWTLDLGTVATIWRGGCIIRARFLNRIKEAYDRDRALAQPAARPLFQRADRQRRRRACGRSSRPPPRHGVAGAGAGLGAGLFRRLPRGAAAGQPDPGAARLFRRPHLRAHRPAGQRAHRLGRALRVPAMAAPMVIVLMGVSGTGKTTIGERLAAALGGDVRRGRRLPPARQRREDAQGIPLDDADRQPWLETLSARDRRAGSTPAAPSCWPARRSSSSYREILRGGRPGVFFVYLKGDPALIRARLAGRRGHYMPPSLLDSQLATLEEPKDALVVGDRRPARARSSRQILAALGRA